MSPTRSDADPLSQPYAVPVPAVDLDRDPFVQGLRERMPEPLFQTFAPEQLEALRTAFGARAWGRHAIDLRATFPVGRRRYYCVLLAGRNKRQPNRSRQDLSLLAKAWLVSLLVLLAILAALGMLYLFKSALNINLFPDFSLGLWDWIKASLDR